MVNILVDPATGLPMQEQAPGGHLMKAASELPSAWMTTLWNAQRGGNTLIRGGFAEKAIAKNINRKAFRNTMVPRSFGRMGSVYNVDSTNSPLKLAEGKETYTPFNILSKGGNWAANKSVGGKSAVSRLMSLAEETRGSGNVSRNAYRAASVVENLGMNTKSAKAAAIGGQKVNLFDAGMLSRLNAGTRIMGRAGQKSANVAKMFSNASKIDSTMADILGSTGFSALQGANPFWTMAGTLKGGVSQYAAGYGGAARYGAPVGEFGEKLLGAESKQALARGATKAAEHLAAGGMERVAGQAGFRVAATEAGEKLAAKAGLEVGAKVGMRAIGTAVAEGGARTGLAVAGAGAMGAMKFVPILGQVLTAYQLGKMGGELMVGAAETAKQAVTSFKGSIDKPIMGMGYKDNAVAATSRQRGVMAIQNSRLNMRSVLGSEAAGMAAHFG